MADEKEIQVVALTDNDGVTIEFELLDTVEYNGGEYALITPFEENLTEDSAGDEAEVFVMKQITENEEVMFEAVEDEKISEAVFVLFQQKHKDEFKFAE
ncbi:MAG: DUF1292 domain-containing protein [Clostridiales bacterium]|jgi:uncharacterized protein YrzB (UPF0473 family)|nr:DUF1292 domain-containing protein [Clostridiales bacterium]